MCCPAFTSLKCKPTLPINRARKRKNKASRLKSRRGRCGWPIASAYSRDATHRLCLMKTEMPGWRRDLQLNSETVTNRNVDGMILTFLPQIDKNQSPVDTTVSISVPKHSTGLHVVWTSHSLTTFQFRAFLFPAITIKNIADARICLRGCNNNSTCFSFWK